jgi:hypothetical protein
MEQELAASMNITSKANKTWKPLYSVTDVVNCIGNADVTFQFKNNKFKKTIPIVNMPKFKGKLLLGRDVCKYNYAFKLKIDSLQRLIDDNTNWVLQRASTHNQVRAKTVPNQPRLQGGRKHVIATPLVETNNQQVKKYINHKKPRHRQCDYEFNQRLENNYINTDTSKIDRRVNKNQNNFRSKQNNKSNKITNSVPITTTNQLNSETQFENITNVPTLREQNESTQAVNKKLNNNEMINNNKRNGPIKIKENKDLSHETTSKPRDFTNETNAKRLSKTTNFRTRKKNNESPKLEYKGS